MILQLNRKNASSQMLKRYTFWLTAGILFQFLTAAVHSLSFIVQPELHNETERQLHELITNYHPEMGLGFHPSFWDLFTALSACFPLLCLLGGLTLGYLLWKQASPDLIKGILAIQVVIFGILFLVVLILTFPPPIVSTGLIFLNLLIAYILAPPIESAV
jgi:hypothetical protein